MIDVGQGDCFFIQQPYNQGNILIDTGGLRNKDLAALTLVPYLRSVGVFKLDHVFILMMILIIVELISHLRIKLKLDILLHHTKINLKLGR